MIGTVESMAYTFWHAPGTTPIWTGGIAGTRWTNAAVQYFGYQCNLTCSAGAIVNFENGPQQSGMWYQDMPPSFPKSVFDTTVPYQPTGNTPGDAAAEAEVNYLRQSVFGVANDPNAIVVLVRPPGQLQSTDGSCARHSLLAPPTYTDWVPFMDLNYGGVNSANNSCYPPAAPSVPVNVANISECFEHEYLEMVADPRPITGFFNWLDGPAPNGPEIGDMCQNVAPIAVGVQATNQSVSTGVAIATISDIAGPGGHCTFARTRWPNMWAMDASGNLNHDQVDADEQAAPYPGWNNWGTLGSPGLIGAPSGAEWGFGRQDVFAVDATNQLRHAFTDYQNAANSTPGFPCAGPDGPCYELWAGNPAPLMANPAVATWGPGRLDVFTTGIAPNHLFQVSMDGSFAPGPWTDRGAPSAGIKFGPAAATYSPGQVSVFVVGNDGNIYRGTYTEATNTLTWAMWLTPPGTAAIADSLDAASWLPGRYDVFLTETDGTLWQCSVTDPNPPGPCVQWAPPTGNTFAHKPSVVQLGDDRLMVAAIGCSSSGCTIWSQLFNWNQTNTGGWASNGTSVSSGVALSDAL